MPLRPIILLGLASLLLYITCTYLYHNSSTGHLTQSSTTVAMSTPTPAPQSSMPTWHAPQASWINNLHAVINSTGTHELLFSPPHTAEKGGYNYCDMPRVNSSEYVVPSRKEWELVYVHVVSHPDILYLVWLHRPTHGFKAPTPVRHVLISRRI